MIYIPKKATFNYYYLFLDNYEKEIYLSILNNLRNYNFSGSFVQRSDQDLNMQINRIFEAILFDNPELFFLSKKLEIIENYNTRLVTLNFKSKYPIKNILRMWNEISSEYLKILNLLNTKSSIIDKIYLLNEYLTRTITYVNSLDPSNGDIYGALVQKRARCEGISNAVKFIFDQLGYNNIIAVGKGGYDNDIEEHAWNIIEINRKFYYFDFTWNNTLSYSKSPSVIHLFLSDQLANIRHHPRFSYPKNSDESLTFWNYNKSVLNSMSEVEQIPVFNSGSNLSFILVKINVPYKNINDLALFIVKKLFMKHRFVNNNFFTFDQSYKLLTIYFTK